MGVVVDPVSEALGWRDVATLERTVKRYQALGLEASLSLTGRDGGRAVIWHVESRNPTASTYQLDIEKYTTRSGKLRWIITVSRSEGAVMIVRRLGQVSSNILLFALTKAEQSISGAKDWEISSRADETSQSELEKLGRLAATLSVAITKPKLRSERPGREFRPALATGSFAEALTEFERTLSSEVQRPLAVTIRGQDKSHRRAETDRSLSIRSIVSVRHSPGSKEKGRGTLSATRAHQDLFSIY